MKEEVKRIMKLVQEGKLSPEDAAELVEAFSDAPATDGEPEAVAGDETQESAKTTAPVEDPISKLIGSIEKIGKDVAKNVNWNDIAGQIRQGVNKGVDAVKKAAEDAKASGGFAAFFGASQTKRVELPLSVPTGKTLRIEVKSGDIIVEGGHDIGSLTIDATFRSNDDEEARRLADTFTPVIEESEHVVVFRLPEGHNLSADVIAKVPAGTPVEIKVATGDIAISATKAAVRIDGSSGDVRIKEAVGSIQINQRSGDVNVMDSEPSILAIETKSGNVKLERTSGVVEIRTSSGDVKVLDSASKNLSVEAASGNISVELTAPICNTVHLTAVTGNISVLVPDGSDCRVNLSTLVGVVKSSIELVDESKDERKVTGRLGEGTGTLDASVVTGNVSFGLLDSTQT